MDEEAKMIDAGKETGITLGSGSLMDDEHSNDVDSDPLSSTFSSDDLGGLDTDSVLECKALVMDMYGIEEGIIGDSDNLFSYD